MHDLEIKLKPIMDQLLPPSGRLIVGVSGGADSMALMHLLTALVTNAQQRLMIVHINHQLRAQAADADQAFVESQARILGIDTQCYRRQIKKLAEKQKKSIEEIGRQERLNCLLQAANEINAKAVVLAHHQDDQIETFLMRLLRGSSAKGLKGMVQSRPFPHPEASTQLKLVRPLLEIKKRALIDYLKSKQLSWQEDKSNQELCYHRNKIRHHLIPLLKKDYNPEVEKLLSQTITSISRDQLFIEKIVEQKKQQVVHAMTQGACAIKCKAFKQLDQAIRWHVISAIWDELKIKQKNALHLGRLIDAILHGHQGLSLPGRWQARSEQAYLVISKNKTKKRVQVKNKAYLLHEGVNSIEALGITVQLSYEKKSGPIVKKRAGLSIAIDPETITALSIRPAVSGDKMRPLGMQGKQKSLKKILSELGLTKEQKAAWPVMTNNDEIIWVIKGPIAESVKLTSQSQSCLKIKVDNQRENSPVL